MTKINKLHFNGVDYDIGDKDIHDLTEKTKPINADEVMIADSEASYVHKKVSVGNLIVPATYIGAGTQGVPTFSDNKDYICGLYSNTLYLAKNGFQFYRDGHLQNVGLSTIYSGYGSALTAIIYNGYIYVIVYKAGSNTNPFKLFKCDVESDITIASNWIYIADFTRGGSSHTMSVAGFDGDYLIIIERKMDSIVYIDQCDLSGNIINQITTSLSQFSPQITFVGNRKYYIGDSNYKIHLYLQDSTYLGSNLYCNTSAFSWCGWCYHWYNASYPVCPQFQL